MILSGVAAFVSVRTEEGFDVSEAVRAKVLALGGTAVKRLSACTHLIYHQGDPRVLAEAREMKKKVATPEWLEVCEGAGMLVSTSAFRPVLDVEPVLVPTVTANGRRRSVVVGGGGAGGGGAKRPRTGKRSFETMRYEHLAMPSPSHPAFSSSQLEGQDPQERERERKRLRKSMGPAARRRSSAAAAKAAAAAAAAADEDEEDEEDEEEGAAMDEEGEGEGEENQTQSPPRTERKQSARKQQSAAKKQSARKASASKRQQEQEEGGEESESESGSEEEWSPARKSVPSLSATTASAHASGKGKGKGGRASTGGGAAAASSAARKEILLAGEEVVEDDMEEESEEEGGDMKPAVKQTGKGGKGKAPRAVAAAAEPGEGEAAAAGRGASWACSVCTAVNRARASKCDACEYPRGFSPKEAAAKEKEREKKRKSEEGGAAPAAKATAAEAKSKGKQDSKKKPEAAPAKKKAAAASEAAKAKAKSSGKAAAAAVAAKKTPRSSTSGSSSKGKDEGKNEKKKAARSSTGGTGGSASVGKEQKQKRRASGASSTASAASSSSADADAKQQPQQQQGPEFVIGCTGLEPAVKEVAVKQAKELGKALAALNGDNGDNGNGTAAAPRVVKFSMSADPSAVLTHLLVPSDGREPRRTAKVLFALARGAHVVTTDWLAESVKALQGQGQQQGQQPQLKGPQPEACFVTDRFPARAAQRDLLEAGAGVGPVFLAPSCVDPGERVLMALVKECGGQVTKTLKDAALVIAPEGPATEAWMRATLAEEGAGGAAKAKAQALRTLLAEHACVTPVWLFDAVDQGVLPEERSPYALPAPGVVTVEAAATAAAADAAAAGFKEGVAAGAEEEEEEVAGWRPVNEEEEAE